MFTKKDPMSLINLGNGAAIEMFDEELQKVLDNIVDPNTKLDQIREITLKVKIKPDEERNLGEISIECPTKLAAAKQFITKCVIGRTGKTGHAREIETGQTSFFDRGDKVIPLDGKEV